MKAAGFRSCERTMGRFDEWMERLREEPQPRKKPKAEEHVLQTQCVRWFAMQYRKCYEEGALFAVPNGGRRDKTTGSMLKAEGVVAGVADLILLKPTAYSHALLIEMKTGTGRQSPSQKAWEKGVLEDGYRYVVVRSLDEFASLIRKYMKDYENYKMIEI